MWINFLFTLKRSAYHFNDEVFGLGSDFVCAMFGRFYVEDYRLLTDHVTVEQYYFQAKQAISGVSICVCLCVCGCVLLVCGVCIGVHFCVRVCVCYVVNYDIES